MAVKLTFKNHIQNHCVFCTGEAVFIDGETKDAAFDTKGDPMNLAQFSYGELRIKVEDNASSPVLNVSIGTIDHKTEEFHEEAAFSELTANGTAMIRLSTLTTRMAINATLTGGTFKVTITGEFKK